MHDETTLRTAVDSWQALLRQLASEIESQMGGRCPWRAADDRCAFTGGCASQRRPARGSGGPIACGGDRRLQWRSIHDEP